MDQLTMEKTEEISETTDYKWEFKWHNIIILVLMHITGTYGLYLSIVSAQWKTVIYGFLLLELGLIGMTAGAHRLWSHRSYTAKLPLKLLLCFFETLSLQHNIHDWVKYHRIHHKYVDTDADPYNAKRGLFYSHFGWFCIKRTPQTLAKYKTIDLSDIYADPIVMFQQKYYLTFFAPVVGVLLPALLPWYCWGESFKNSFYVTAMLRFALAANFTATINSFAHKYGHKPYDKKICPTENLAVSVVTLGEGWHNFHHTFPLDYKAAEFGKYPNVATAFIELMAAVGWAYDLKTVSEEMIMKRATRTGDGTELWNQKNKQH